MLPIWCCGSMIATVMTLGVESMARAPGFSMQIGGMALHEGNIAEMKTGEGKTLVATLPTYLNALTGRGVHVITVNDYLADRDSHWYACHLCRQNHNVACASRLRRCRHKLVVRL